MEKLKMTRTKQAYFEPHQLEKLLEAAKAHGPREHAMFLFGFAHGARAQEICNLRLSDLDFRNGRVHIARLKGSLDSVQPFMHIKGYSLFDEERAFKGWLAVREPDSGDYVFNSQKSIQLHRATTFKLFRRLCDQAGLPRALAHPHTLKHTTAMMMLLKNASAFFIKQYLGHKSLNSTLQYSAPSDQDAGKAAAKAFSEIF